jgi:hypothetical protein
VSYTLNGLLNSLTVEITPTQILALVGSPISLIGAPGVGKANLLQTLICSLEFGSTKYIGGPTASAALFYLGKSQYPALGSWLPPGAGGFNAGPSWGYTPEAGGPEPWLAIASVASAVGGNTVYAGPIPGGADDAYAGLPVSALTFSHSANNGSFTCLASTAGTLTLDNPSGVADAGGVVLLEFPLGTFGAGVGYGNDLSFLLTGAAVSCVFGSTLNGWAYPTSEIENAAVMLGNPLPPLLNPANFTAGDSSLALTLTYLTVDL